MEHREKFTVHPPVVTLEKFERFDCRSKERLGGDPIVVFEEIMKLFRHGKHHMEMRAIRQPLTHLLGPLRLLWPEAIGAMPVVAGTRKPFAMTTFLAAHHIVSQRTLAAERHEVEGRMRLFAQTSKPEITPFAQNTVDRRFYSVYVDTLHQMTQVEISTQ